MKDPQKILRCELDDMRELLTGALESIDKVFYKRMKSLWLTNKLDGSEDHLVSEKICTIVGEGFLVKQNNLMQNTSLTSLQ